MADQDKGLTYDQLRDLAREYALTLPVPPYTDDELDSLRRVAALKRHWSVPDGATVVATLLLEVLRLRHRNKCVEGLLDKLMGGDGSGQHVGKALKDLDGYDPRRDRGSLRGADGG